MKTVREASFGKTKLRLVNTGKNFVGLLLSDGKKQLEISGEDGDEVWSKIQAEAGKANPNYFGMDGARARFLHWFAGGFESPSYLSEERAYKVAAKQKLDAAAPLELAATGSGYGEAVLSAYRATNLLYPVEKTRLQGLLRGSDADAFVRAIARFALGERSALGAIDRILRVHDNARWTVASYPGFLWRPDDHIFLKPEVTKDFAERVGHPFAHIYNSELRIEVYDSLLSLAADVASAFADLHPRDNIDIQSVIFVVGDYREDREIPKN